MRDTVLPFKKKVCVWGWGLLVVGVSLEKTCPVFTADLPQGPQAFLLYSLSGQEKNADTLMTP